MSVNKAAAAPKNTEAMEEVDYDVNPTRLYETIQHKKWDEVKDLVEAHPQQTKTWVVRKQSLKKGTQKNNIRWRLLPLHASIVFKAPESTIQTLLSAYPRACCYKDDQGMLPIHLALRNESSLAIITMLLLAFPQCAQIGDRKNRTARDLINKVPSYTQLVETSATVHSSMTLKEQYIYALEHFDKYYDVASASHDAFALFESKNNPATNIQGSLDVQKLSLMGKVDSLELEVARSRDENQLLVDHINSLTAQLDSQSDNSSYLMSKIGNLESTIQEIRTEKEFMEAQYTREKDATMKHMKDLQSDIDGYQEEIDLYRQLNDEKDKSIEIHHQSKTTFFESVANDKQYYQDKVKKLEIENASVLANAAILEAQLKKKIQNEHSLASQVSDLASKLSENALMCTEMNKSHEIRIDTYQREKMEMRQSYDVLCIKLKDALYTMDEMTTENNRIVQLSTKQEQIISQMYKQQEELASHTARHEQNLIDAAWEREEIVKVLTRQAEEVAKTKAERETMLNVIKENNKLIAETAEERSQFIDSVSKQQGLMEILKKGVTELHGVVTNKADVIDGISFDEDDDCEKENNIKSQVIKCNTKETIEEDGEEETRNKNDNPRKDSSGKLKCYIHEAFSSESSTISSGVEDEFEACLKQELDQDDVISNDENVIDNMKEEDEEKEEEAEDEFEGCLKQDLEEEIVNPNDENEGDFSEEDVLGEISMNIKNLSMEDRKNESLSDVESSVDNLCKEAAALIASIPSPEKNH
jgi:hypothetical protein